MSDLEPIGVTFEGDSSSLQSAAKEAEESLNSLSAAASDTTNNSEETDKLAEAIQRYANACGNASAEAANIDLTWISDGIKSISEMQGKVDGLEATVQNFNDGLKDLSKSRIETRDGFAELRKEFQDLLYQYQNGKVTLDETRGRFAELTECYKAQKETAEELEYGANHLNAEVRESANALEHLETASESANDKQEEVAQTLERAAKEAAKAAKEAEKQAKAEELLSTKTKLATKSASELREEIIRLTKAKREAAAAGNAQAEEQYNQQLVEAKKQLREVTNETNLAKTAMLGKAQAGMQVASTLGNLAKQARTGSINFAEMATSIMGVSMAIKAGLGPIGWAMAAVQGLQMAWDYFSNSQKEAKEATENAAKALAELNNELERNAIAVSNAKFGELKANLERETESLNEATQRQLRTHDTAVKADAAKTASLIKQAKCRIDASKAEMQAMVDTGQMSAEEMAAQSAQLDAELAAMQREADDKAEAAQKKRLEILRDGLNEQRDLTRTALHDFEFENGAAFTRFWTDEVDAQANRLKAQVDEISADLKGLEADRKSLLEQLVAAKKNGDDQLANVIRLSLKNTEHEIKVTSLQLDDATKEFRDVIGELIDDKEHRIFQLGGEQFVRAALDLRAKGKELEEKRDEIQQAIFENGDSIEDAERSAQLRQDELKAQEESTRITEEANRAKEEALQAQREISEQIKSLGEQYKTHGKYAESSSLTQQEIYEADKATLEARLEELRALQSKGGHSEVSTKALSDAIADAESQLRGLAQAMEKDAAAEAAKRVSSALRSLEQEYKVSTNYAKQSGKSQAQIQREDLRILQEKEKQLMQLRSAPGIDAQTEEGINRALAATREQISGVKSAMAQTAANARRWIRETEPPDLQAKNKVVKHNLDLLAKGYKLAAARAAKAAEKGDWQAYERAMRTMGNTEKSMAKLAKNSGQVAAYTAPLASHVRSIEASARAGASSEKEATKAAKKKAAAQKKAAATIEQERPKEKVEDASAKIAELSSQMKRAEQQMEKLSEQVLSLKGAIQGLASATGNAASAVGEVASAANSAIKSCERRIKSCEKAIVRLRR